MKNLMKVISVFILVTMIIVIIPLFGIDMSSSFMEFYVKVLEVLLLSILPILSISICCYCLERNDENYFLRIIPIYMVVYIGLAVILYMFLDGKADDGIGKAIDTVMDIMAKPQLALTFISATFIIKPNNAITNVLKKIAYGLIILNVVLTAWIAIKEQMEEKLPNVYNYDGYYGEGFNFSSLSSTRNFANKVYDISLVGEIFIILLLFTTNYAFSTKVEIEADDINYDVLKKEAEALAQSQMAANTSFAKEEKVIDRSQSEKGLMNVNNQLGADSNVGKVKESAKEINIQETSMEAIMPLSKGPVANQTANVAPQPQSPQVVPQMQPQETQNVPPQLPNPFDQPSVNNQNQAPPTPPQSQNKFLQ